MKGSSERALPWGGAMEVGMASAKHYPFWTHDTVAAAVLAGVGMASLQTKLDAWAGELNLPAVSACVRGWPMLVMFAGLVLLLLHSVEGRVEIPEEPQRALSDAVGNGLGDDEDQGFPADDEDWNDLSIVTTASHQSKGRGREDLRKIRFTYSG